MPKKNKKEENKQKTMREATKSKRKVANEIQKKINSSNNDNITM